VAGRALVLASIFAVAATLAAASPARMRADAQWRLVFYDNFKQGLNTLWWGAYNGQPGGDPGGWWSPSHVVVNNGVLNLQTYRDPRYGRRWVSGGISSGPALKQTYGKYEIRVRMDAGKGVGIAALLWPARNMWPPEIDFAENGGETGIRRTVTATLHWGRVDHQAQRQIRVDFTRWHTLGVEWLPGQLIYTIDGRQWAVLKSSAVPAQPMELDIQTQAGTCGEWWAPCPDRHTPQHVNAQIAWVAAYAYQPSASGSQTNRFEAGQRPRAAGL
jgi:beta-glucanase (GH16 family)